MSDLLPPRSIYHGFNALFTTLTRDVPRLARAGFDAIQISPAQRSPPGSAWYLRYQPVSYAHIDGLGGEAELRDLCVVAREHQVAIIADCVFNHMVVVASCEEWRKAQEQETNGDSSLIEILKQRLETAVESSGLDRTAFQWPWHQMDGADWDNENRYEGWGCGEWSELKDCPKTVDAHCRHLQTLFDCGVRGFRFDAAKHMRPQHIAKYVDFLRKKPEAVYLYGEVLSVERSMHEEYTQPLGIASTDFLLCNMLFQTLGCRPTEPKTEKEEIGASHDLQSLPVNLVSMTLGPSHVVFTRNHDTVYNDDPVLGINWSSLRALPATSLLLALPTGTVLLLPEDAQISGPGLRFRALMSGEAQEAELSVSHDLVVVTRRPRDSREIVGMAVINTAEKHNEVSVEIAECMGTLGEICEEEGIGATESASSTRTAPPSANTVSGLSARFFVCKSLLQVGKQAVTTKRKACEELQTSDGYHTKKLR
eukprot:TRINITY_DN60964_c0_g1_i1.p1 TRINITY_DN60964_c0_g1~~TRINITY_DN60964_c0_g1_i1.p1  ORF type:complete len:481 (+),score=67.52 TRINITY_DN60964_c0_g1_i1:56-1498(+)